MLGVKFGVLNTFFVNESLLRNNCCKYLSVLDIRITTPRLATLFHEIRKFTYAKQLILICIKLTTQQINLYQPVSVLGLAAFLNSYNYFKPFPKAISKTKFLWSFPRMIRPFVEEPLTYVTHLRYLTVV